MKQKQGKLERLVRFSKISAIAMALALIPTSISSKNIPLSQSQAHAKQEHKLGRAHQLLVNFPESHEIPGAEYVNRFFNPKANYLAILVRRLHADDKKMSRAYKKQLIKVNNHVYYIHLSLKKHFGIPAVRKEAVTPETLEDYYLVIDSYRSTKDILDLMEEIRKNKPECVSRKTLRRFRKRYERQQLELQYDAVKRLAVEGKIKVLPAETLDKYKRAGELYAKGGSGDVTYGEIMNAICRVRELQSLDFASRQKSPITDFDYGKGHAAGGYVDITKCSFIQTVMEWNSRPENKYKQFCAAIITPWDMDKN